MAEAAHAPTGWLVGAYAASPSRVGWDPGAEADYLDGLAALPGVIGVELPWTRGGAFHVHDEGWMLDRLPDDARVVVTMAPDASARHRESAAFGLASTDLHGRRAAVEAVRDLHAALPRLRAALPVGDVVAVELHAATRATPGAAEPALLRDSLAEIGDWGWEGSRLVVEHCDAWRPEHPPSKGYLPLEDEVAVVAALRDQGLPVGVVVNWGRSVIECRDADAGREHAALAAAAGVLDGVVLSGAATEATPLGAAWADVHAPFAAPGPYASSLLTPERAAATLDAAGELAFRAVKVAAPPSATVDDRVALVAAALEGARAFTPVAS